MTATATPAAKKAPHVGLVLTGLMLGILLAALDQTIVGTSLFKIVGDIGGFEHFAWLFSSYMLASTIVIPLAGKFSDIWGRRPVYIVGMVVFLIGSWLCGTATEMTQLIIYRGIQGLGGGAIFPVALATIADLYPPSERGRISGLFGAVFGLSSVIGPFVGGWIVDYAHVGVPFFMVDAFAPGGFLNALVDGSGYIDSWRWAFYVNVPVGIAAITMVALFFPRIDTRHRVPIDYVGIATITVALVSLLMITIWGGDAYAWLSWQIGALVALTALAVGAFVWAEKRAEDPLIPLELFHNPVFRIGVVVSILAGAAMFTVITFMPTYLQGVVGISATYSGTALIPLSLGLVAGSIVSGNLMKRFGYKPFILAGFVIAIVGYLLLSRLGAHPPVWLAIVEMALLGLGIGFTIQTLIVAAQNAVERRHVGVATSSITLFRTLGATLGVTALGVVLNRAFEREASARIAPEWMARFTANPELQGEVSNIPRLLSIPEALAQISAAPGGAEAIEAIKVSFAHAMAVIFIAGAAISVVALGIAAFLKVIPMKGREEFMGDATKMAPTAEL